MLAKKGIYGIITAFFVICIAIFVVLSLTQVMSIATLFKVQTADDAQRDVGALGTKGMVRACLGRIIDLSKNNTPCMDRISVGVVMSIVNATGCQAANITIRPTVQYSAVEVYNQPVYQNGSMICPGRLQIYT
jgi:hypothetical protein